MASLSYYRAKFFSRFHKNSNEYMCNYFRKAGCRIGKNAHIFSDLATSEAYLISIGNNTTIASGVTLLTHDASPGPIYGREKYSDICGKITIGDNCFIGSGSIILCGITIPDNTIVAAGSVVTHSVEKSGIIIGGNPAKPISTLDRYKEKNDLYLLSLQGLNHADRKKAVFQGKLIKR